MGDWTIAEKIPFGTSDPWAVSFKKPVHEKEPLPVLSQVVVLSVACENLYNADLLTKSDPFVEVSTFPRGTQKGDTKVKPLSVGRTEMIQDCLNPKFVNTIRVTFLFEELQLFNFQVWDGDAYTAKDLLGGVRDIELARIVGAGAQGLRIPLEVPKMANTLGSKKSTIIVTATPEMHGLQELRLQASGLKMKKMDTFSKSDCFLRISKWNGASFMPVHQTEVDNNTLSPIWKPMHIPLDKLIGEDEGRTKLRIECFDEDISMTGKRSEEYMGEFDTCLDELCAGPQSKELNQLKSQKKGSAGTIQLNGELVTKSSYLDYIQGGTKVEVAFAVDFTISNGDPSKTSSLHYIQGKHRNQYHKAIERVSTILLPLDSDGRARISGFGGVCNGKTSFFFPLSADGHWEAAEVDGLVNAYLHGVQNYPLAGPTNLAPTIRGTIKSLQGSAPGSRYAVLVILTDGEITDEADTLAAIYDACSYPISILLIGVGYASFGFLEKLDGDGYQLTSNGKPMPRDIVQFVPYRRFSDLTDLTTEVLAEIPRQIEEFMFTHDIRPQSI